MQAVQKIIKRIVTALPVVTIIGASFFPMKMWAQQALVFFILIWFYVFMLFDVFGK